MGIVKRESHKNGKAAVDKYTLHKERDYYAMETERNGAVIAAAAMVLAIALDMKFEDLFYFERISFMKENNRVGTNSQG